MSEKKSFALRIDSETMESIEKWAADEFRSTNGQIEWILNEALKKAGRLKKDGGKRNDKQKEG
ncbi:MAG: Arc family DNA-binding protein [Bacteroidota bacterium]